MYQIVCLCGYVNIGDSNIIYTIIKTTSVCDGRSVGDWLALHGKQT